MISRFGVCDRAIPNTLPAEADSDGIVVYGSPKGSFMNAADPRDRGEAAMTGSRSQMKPVAWLAFV
jgi:hypothetical protein